MRLTRNNDLQASDGILKTGHLLRRNEFKRSFYREIPNVALMVSIITLAENDDSEACDCNLHIGHILDRNAVE